MFRRLNSTSKSKTSIAILGGGPIGSSIALHLCQKGYKNVTVIDRDLSFKSTSSVLSAGGIRQQFSLPENILMSKYSADFIIKAALESKSDSNIPDVQFHNNGYLFLASPTNEALFKKVNQTQQDTGISYINLLMPSELKAKFPWISTDGLSSASYGGTEGGEGYFDPYALVMYMKKKVYFSQVYTFLRCLYDILLYMYVLLGYRLRRGVHTRRSSRYGSKYILFFTNT